MGLFDLFQRTPKDEPKRDRRQAFSEFSGGDYSHVEQKGPVTVFHPKSFNDVELIIKTLKNGQQAMVYLNELSDSTCFRVLDMLCGAIYALDGGVYELEKNIFMFTPTGVESR